MLSISLRHKVQVRNRFQRIYLSQVSYVFVELNRLRVSRSTKYFKTDSQIQSQLWVNDDHDKFQRRMKRQRAFSYESRSYQQIKKSSLSRSFSSTDSHEKNWKSFLKIDSRKINIRFSSSRNVWWVTARDHNLLVVFIINCRIDSQR
jgi:hypothetical protein